MKRTLHWLSMLTVVVLLIMLVIPASATTMDNFIIDVFAKVLVPDATVFFGEAGQSGETNIEGIITGSYEVFKGIPTSSIETYVNVMEQYYKFSSSKTDLSDKKINQWIFDKEDYRLLLLYSYDMNQAVLVYQKDFEIDSIDNLAKYADQSLKITSDERAKAEAALKEAQDQAHAIAAAIAAMEDEAEACNAELQKAKEDNDKDQSRVLEEEYKAKIKDISDTKLELITAQNDVDALAANAQECSEKAKAAQDFANNVKNMLEKH